MNYFNEVLSVTTHCPSFSIEAPLIRNHFVHMSEQNTRSDVTYIRWLPAGQINKEYHILWRESEKEIVNTNVGFYPCTDVLALYTLPSSVKQNKDCEC